MKKYFLELLFLFWICFIALSFLLTYYLPKVFEVIKP
jgi:hypothetical protein